MALAIRSRPDRGRWVVIGAMALVLLASIAALIVGLGDHGGAPAATPNAIPAPEAIPTQGSELHEVQDGRVSAWAMPDALVGPTDVVAAGDGRVFVAEQHRGAMDAFDPETGADVRYLFHKPFPDMGSIYSLALGPDGSVWFAGWPDEPFGRLLPDGTGNAFGTGGQGLATGAVAADQTGAMWVTYTRGSRLLRIDPSGHLTYVTVPDVHGKPGYPMSIARGIDSMWFTMGDNDAIARVTLGEQPQVTVYDMPRHSLPFDLASAPDGSLWVTLREGRSLAHVQPDGTYQIFPLRAASGLLGSIEIAADGSLWVSQDAPWIMHVDPTGRAIERIALPKPLPDANGLSIDPHGAVWGASGDGNAIFRIRPP